MFKQIEEYVEGAACANCWGVGKTFGDVPTPKRITITCAGFVGACAVINGTHIVIQDPVFLCIYEFDDGIAAGRINFGLLTTTFQIRISGGAWCFVEVAAACSKVCTVGDKSVTIAIDLPQTPGYKIAIEQNFSPSLETHYLNLGAANGDEVLVLARRHDRIKLHVRYDPEY